MYKTQIIKEIEDTLDNYSKGPSSEKYVAYPDIYSLLLEKTEALYREHKIQVDEMKKIYGESNYELFNKITNEIVGKDMKKLIGADNLNIKF